MSRRRPTLVAKLAAFKADEGDRMKLEDGSRVAVVGGGPAGSFFSYFLLEMAQRTGTEITVDIFEPRDFTQSGPASCNMCGGIVSESLVQALATEGINLPPAVVQRGIDSYMLHSDVGSVRIDTPLQEKRIAAIHRGGGPRGVDMHEWQSLDDFLMKLAVSKGARHVMERVVGFDRIDGLPAVQTKDGSQESYDLLAIAVGVNANALKLLETTPPPYGPPTTTKTFIREFYLGRDVIADALGNSMHVFLLDLPGLEFAALIPKGDCVTLCMLGEKIDRDLVQAFLAVPQVGACLPEGLELDKGVCQCSPRIAIEAAREPFGDRVLYVGDCGVTRLYKDGIGAAYRTAKAAAVAAALHGISAADLRRHYLPACNRIASDNRIGKFIFALTRQIQKRTYARRAVLKMVAAEQLNKRRLRMSTVLWDTFTGSAPYREVFGRCLNPVFVGHLFWNTVRSLVNTKQV